MRIQANKLNQISLKDFWICTFLSVAIFFIFTPFSRDRELLHTTLDIIGASLVFIGAIGRFITNLYHYNDRINTKGPYSIVRYPKCVLAYIAMIGLSLVTCRIQLIALMPFMAGFIYLYLINRQDNLMILLYGDEFREYQRKVPRLLPDFSKYIPTAPHKIPLKDFTFGLLEIALWLGIALVIEKMEMFGF